MEAQFRLLCRFRFTFYVHRINISIFSHLKINVGALTSDKIFCN